jgi:hypothetical protein
MSNIAEKLPQLVRDTIEEVETRGRDLVGRIDTWVEKNIPENVAKKFQSDSRVDLEAIRTAASAASEELATRLRESWVVLRGDKPEDA